MDRELDVFTNYRTITNKVKKRFLKKPNYSEASDQFGTLTRVLRQQECPQYAGFCCLAKARCENTLSNSIAEVEALLEAARYVNALKLSEQLLFWYYIYEFLTFQFTRFGSILPCPRSVFCLNALKHF